MPPQRTSRGQVAKVNHVSGYRGCGLGVAVVVAAPMPLPPGVPSVARQRAQEGGGEPVPRLRLDTELQAALGDRYDQFLAEARNLDFDDTIAQLIRSQPAAH